MEKSLDIRELLYFTGILIVMWHVFYRSNACVCSSFGSFVSALIPASSVHWNRFVNSCGWTKLTQVKYTVEITMQIEKIKVWFQFCTSCSGQSAKWVKFYNRSQCDLHCAWHGYDLFKKYSTVAHCYLLVWVDGLINFMRRSYLWFPWGHSSLTLRVVKPKSSKQLTRTKITSTKRLWKLGFNTPKRPRARKITSDLVAVGFMFALVCILQTNHGACQ